MPVTIPEDVRPPDLHDRTYFCRVCGGIMLREAADFTESGPTCPICQSPLDEDAEAREKSA